MAEVPVPGFSLARLLRKPRRAAEADAPSLDHIRAFEILEEQARQGRLPFPADHVAAGPPRPRLSLEESLDDASRQLRRGLAEAGTMVAADVLHAPRALAELPISPDPRIAALQFGAKAVIRTPGFKRLEKGLEDTNREIDAFYGHARDPSNGMFRLLGFAAGTTAAATAAAGAVPVVQRTTRMLRQQASHLFQVGALPGPIDRALLARAGVFHGAMDPIPLLLTGPTRALSAPDELGRALRATRRLEVARTFGLARNPRYAPITRVRLDPKVIRGMLKIRSVEDVAKIQRQVRLAARGHRPGLIQPGKRTRAEGFVGRQRSLAQATERLFERVPVVDVRGGLGEEQLLNRLLGFGSFARRDITAFPAKDLHMSLGEKQLAIQWPEAVREIEAAHELFGLIGREGILYPLVRSKLDRGVVTQVTFPPLPSKARVTEDAIAGYVEAWTPGPFSPTRGPRPDRRLVENRVEGELDQMRRFRQRVLGALGDAGFSPKATKPGGVTIYERPVEKGLEMMSLFERQVRQGKFVFGESVSSRLAALRRVFGPLGREGP